MVSACRSPTGDYTGCPDQNYTHVLFNSLIFKGPDVGWERNTPDRAFQADMPLMAALLSHLSEIEVVGSRNPSCLESFLPRGDRSELV